MAEGVPYTIHGVKVTFPCKAYPTQLSMMDKIMRGLDRRQHCLLESPTGSGKSLALLCSCIAWQAGEYEKASLLKQEKNSNEGPCCASAKPSACETKPITSPPAVIDLTLPQTSSTPATVKQEEKNNTIDETEEQPQLIEDEDEGDFKSDSKRFRTPVTSKYFQASSGGIDTSFNENKVNTTNPLVSPPEWTMAATKQETSPITSPCNSDGKIKSQEIIVPKIYFGTRTHKQVSQIARELGKTAYKHTRMCILSSREHTCIHPVVSKNSNKNDECRKLLDPSNKGETCIYFQRPSVIGSHTAIKHEGLVTAWDIEDFVRVGRKKRACPYYSARELMQEADIIFCPYNYLIDPKIRKQMDIDLKDQIVILDEAHNIEDSARESASMSIDTLELQELLDDMDKMVQWGIMVKEYQALHVMCAGLSRWLVECSERGNMTNRGFEQAVLVLSGEEIFTGLRNAGMTSASLSMYKNAFSEIMENDKNPDNDYMKTSPTSRSVSVLEGLFLVLGYLFGFDGKFLADYRVSILKTAVFVRNQMAGAWKRAGIATRKEWKYSLNIWCFNPAVVFSELGKQARTIILTSGTLSPMSSFASELGVPFPIKLEANHVIANSQVWVGSLAVGPSNSPVNATYRFAETFSFQDDIGNIVLDVCQKIPHGVLCFFPSYNMLDKVSKRWQSTGLWAKLLQKKLVLSEPRSGDKSDFDDVMHEFYSAIRRSEGEEDQECLDSDDEECYGSQGALFLAVCRGKVSEGLDFADNNARAVITVGIPFPNTKDLKIDLKRKYNDSYTSKRGLLNGSEWYEIQAFRALNQALGRCIRHKQDWGAILLVDERFSKNTRYTNGISKWVRQRLHHYKNYTQAVNSLKDFAEARQLVPCPATQTTPRSVSTGGGGGFFVNSSPIKSNTSLNSTVSTPMTSKTDVSMTPGLALNSPQVSSTISITNRLLDSASVSTPKSHLRSTKSSPVNVATNTVSSPPTSSVDQMTAQNNQSTTRHVTVEQPMAVTAGIANGIAPVNKQGVPIATGMTQVPPRLIFIPNNVLPRAPTPATPSTVGGARQVLYLRTPVPTTPTSTGCTQQVIYLTPIQLNGQAAHSPNTNSISNVTDSNVVSAKQLCSTASQRAPSTNKELPNLANPLPKTVNVHSNHSLPNKSNTASPMLSCTTKVVDNSTSTVSSTSSHLLDPAIKAVLNSATNRSNDNVNRDGQNDMNVSNVGKIRANNGNSINTNIGNDEHNSKTVADQVQHVNDVDMIDFNCPSSPELFATPPSEDTNHSSDLPGNGPCPVQDNSSTVEHTVQTDSKAPKPVICNSNIKPVTPAAFNADMCLASNIKVEQLTLEHSTLESKSYEKTVMSKDTSQEEAVYISGDSASSKKVCIEQNLPDAPNEETSTKPARKNLRIATRRSSKEVMDNKVRNVNEKSVADGVSQVVHCKWCSSALYKGTVTQQPMFSQELLSLHDKFLAPKPRQNSKKRKRGDYGGGKTVWMSKDLDCMPNAVQSLPIQDGAVFNALYKDETVFIPVICSGCHGNPKIEASVLGVQVIKTPTTKQLWFFSDSVVL